MISRNHHYLAREEQTTRLTRKNKCIAFSNIFFDVIKSHSTSFISNMDFGIINIDVKLIQASKETLGALVRCVTALIQWVEQQCNGSKDFNVQ